MSFFGHFLDPFFDTSGKSARKPAGLWLNLSKPVKKRSRNGSKKGSFSDPKRVIFGPKKGVISDPKRVFDPKKGFLTQKKGFLTKKGVFDQKGVFDPRVPDYPPRVSDSPSGGVKMVTF